MVVMRPPLTVIVSEQASGQSSGHAVSTVDSGGAMAGRMAMRHFTPGLSGRRAAAAPGACILSPRGDDAALKAARAVRRVWRRRHTMIGTPHVVIVGGGFAGLSRRPGARRRRGRGDGRRPPQPPRVPAAALPGGHRRPVAGRHRRADPLGAAAAAQPSGVARRGGPGRRRRPSGRAGEGGGPAVRTRSSLATGVTHAYFGHEDWAVARPG